MLAFLSACFTLPVTAQTKAQAHESTRLYRNGDLKIAFRLPLQWAKRKCSYSKDDTKCVALRPRDGLKSPEPAITIEVTKSGLEKILSEHVLFEKRGAVWVKHGRFNESQAVAISGFNWSGFEASASCGISDEETGFHAAAGICYTAIVSNGVLTAVIETDGFESTLDVAGVLRDTFRFIK